MVKSIVSGKLTISKRECDGSNVAAELYSTYPVRLQVTSRPGDKGKGRNMVVPVSVELL